MSLFTALKDMIVEGLEMAGRVAEGGIEWHLPERRSVSSWLIYIGTMLTGLGK
jgi:hypothetical protein